MTSINEKLGIRPAGKRNMMKLPSNRQLAADLTAAQCPNCGQRGAIEYMTRGVRRRSCTWCGHGWTPDPVAA